MALLSAAMAGINAGGAYMFAAWSVSSLVASHLVDKASWLEHIMSNSAGSCNMTAAPVRAPILEHPDKGCNCGSQGLLSHCMACPALTSLFSQNLASC